jgi:asparagine synthase (glutamine-hydrolysing)
MDEVLFDLMEPALASGRCLVSFSGGRESAFVLAAATAAARTRGYGDPIPATLRYPLAATSKEVEHQEQIVRCLGLDDWQRIEILDEFELIGPLAQRALREAGVLFPVTSYMLLPLLDLARDGWLLAGGGWTDFFAFWRWTRLGDAFAGRRPVGRRELRQLSLALLPPPGRRAVLRSQNHPRLPPWLREEASRAAEQVVRARAADVPVHFARALERQRAHRCYAGVRASLDALAASAGARALMPFRTDAYIGALAARGGRWGLGDRTETFRRLAGHLLREDLLRRPDGVNEQHVVFGEQASSFVERWSGHGVDPDVVDPDALRASWSRENFAWSSSTLLQLAFLHDEAAWMPGRRKVRTALTAVGGGRQSGCGPKSNREEEHGARSEGGSGSA